MDEREAEVWGFKFSCMGPINLQCFDLLKMSDRFGSASTYTTKRDALNALATRLKQLMDEENE
jgi:hypothetical protein